MVEKAKDAHGVEAEPRRGPGRPRTHFDRKRNGIIKSATKLFAEKGFNATSMADICEAAGIGRGVLYHYIGSKSEILADIYQTFIDPLLETAQAILSANEPAEVTLRKLSANQMESIAEHLPEVTVFFSEWKPLTETESWPGIRNKVRDYHHMIRETIARGRREGVFRDMDTNMAALAFLGMHNYSYQWLRLNGPLTPSQISQIFCDIFIAGIRNSPRNSGGGWAEERSPAAAGRPRE